jgi:hypothetical protein
MFTRSDRAMVAVMSMFAGLLVLADAYGNRFDPTLDVALVAFSVGGFIGFAVILFAWNVATYRK